MAKRFINPDWRALRKLPDELQRAWFYIWDKADEAGVYYLDTDYMKLDLCLNEPLTINDLSKLPECEILPGERILIKNFLVVNYKNLKPDYNPHKPAFRDIEKNNLTLNSSLNQAYLKLEEEDKDKEEDKDLGKSENPLKTGPDLKEVERVFQQQGGTKEMALHFFNHHEAMGWNIRGTPIKNFSSLAGNYISNWHKNNKNGTLTNGNKSHSGNKNIGGLEMLANNLKQQFNAG